MLMVHEQEEVARGKGDEMRLALLSSGVPMKVLFPDTASKETASAEEAIEASGPVEWVSTASPEEAYEVLERLGMMKGSGELTSEDLLIDIDPTLVGE